jgi:hypothetical protein
MQRLRKVVGSRPRSHKFLLLYLKSLVWPASGLASMSGSKLVGPASGLALVASWAKLAVPHVRISQQVNGLH